MRIKLQTRKKRVLWDWILKFRSYRETAPHIGGRFFATVQDHPGATPDAPAPWMGESWEETWGNRIATM